MLATLIDIPFSISPVIVGLAYLMTFGRLGWFYPVIRWFNEIFGTNVRIHLCNTGSCACYDICHVSVCVKGNYTGAQCRGKG